MNKIKKLKLYIKKPKLYIKKPKLYIKKSKLYIKKPKAYIKKSKTYINIKKPKTYIKKSKTYINIKKPKLYIKKPKLYIKKSKTYINIKKSKLSINNLELSPIYKNKIVFTTHRGWTDIINSLPLLSYYAKNEEVLVYFIIPIEFKILVEYYTKISKNIKLIIWNARNREFAHIIHTDDYLMLKILKILNLKFDSSEIKFIGDYDIEREDNYKGSFKKNILKDKSDFVNLFYSSYDIDPIERVNSFNLDRDLDLENKRYEEFIANFGDKYILHHEIPECAINSDIKYINLNRRTSIFFDYVKILENAIEIHLLDSVWGAVCYLLDAKYKLFQNKKIFLYAKRGHYKMFVSPLELQNWTIIK